MADDDHCPICDEALQNLEDIDDDADAVGVRMVKTDDTAFSEFIGLSQFPSIVYYEHSNPHIYDGMISHIFFLLRAQLFSILKMIWPIVCNNLIYLPIITYFKRKDI